MTRRVHVPVSRIASTNSNTTRWVHQDFFLLFSYSFHRSLKNFKTIILLIVKQNSIHFFNSYYILFKHHGEISVTMISTRDTLESHNACSSYEHHISRLSIQLLLFFSSLFCSFFRCPVPDLTIRTTITQGSRPLVQRALHEGQSGHHDASPNKPGFKNKIFNVFGIHSST